MTGTRGKRPENPVTPFISKEAINALPLRRYEGPVVVVRGGEGLERALALLRGEKILGFDTETKPAFRKGQSNPPALLQLASERAVVLVRLTGGGLPKPVKAILQDGGIVKAGVAPDFDVRQLAALSPFEPAGFVDLADMAAERGFKNGGLRGLAANLLGMRISKGARLSNWARDRLTPSQVRYAATDAWVSRLLYLSLSGFRKVESGDGLAPGGD